MYYSSPVRCACAVASDDRCTRTIDGVCRVRAGVRLPASHRSIYGYFVDLDSGNFVPWDALIPPTKTLIEKGALSSIGETALHRRHRRHVVSSIADLSFLTLP